MNRDEFKIYVYAAWSSAVAQLTRAATSSKSRPVVPTPDRRHRERLVLRAILGKTRRTENSTARATIAYSEKDQAIFIHSKERSDITGLADPDSARTYFAPGKKLASKFRTFSKVAEPIKITDLLDIDRDYLQRDLHCHQDVIPFAGQLVLVNDDAITWIRRTEILRPVHRAIAAAEITSGIKIVPEYLRTPARSWFASVAAEATKHLDELSPSEFEHVFAEIVAAIEEEHDGIPVPCAIESSGIATSHTFTITRVCSGRITAEMLVGAARQASQPISAKPVLLIIGTETETGLDEELANAAAAIGGFAAAILLRSDVLGWLSRYPWLWSKYLGRHRLVQVFRAANRNRISELFFRTLTVDEARAVVDEFAPRMTLLAEAFVQGEEIFRTAYGRLVSDVWQRVSSVRPLRNAVIPDGAITVMQRLRQEPSRYYREEGEAPAELDLLDRLYRELGRLVHQCALPVFLRLPPYDRLHTTVDFDDDVRQHMVVFGPEGGGKTTTLGYLVMVAPKDVVIAFGALPTAEYPRLATSDELGLIVKLVEDLIERGHTATITLERLDIEAGRAAADTTLATILEVAARINKRLRRIAIRVLMSVEVPMSRTFAATYRRLLASKGYIWLDILDGNFVASFVEACASALELFMTDDVYDALYWSAPRPGEEQSSNLRRGEVSVGELAYLLQHWHGDAIAAEDVLKFFDLPEDLIERRRSMADEW